MQQHDFDFSFEPVLRSEIYPDLEQGRPNWDLPHTEAVVRVHAALSTPPDRIPPCGHYSGRLRRLDGRNCFLSI
jgi:hypothetical protein